MSKPSTALRIGLVVALCAGTPSGGGCGCGGRGRAVSDGGHSADGAAFTRLDGSQVLGARPDAAGDAEDDGVVVGAAGDIACAGCAQGATADVLHQLLETRRMVAVLPLGG